VNVEYLCKTKSIMLWCDARANKDQPTEKADGKRQSKAEDKPPSKQNQIEDELEQICEELNKRHGAKYSIPQLLCWARLLKAGSTTVRMKYQSFLPVS